MADERDDTQALIERLNKLERENRRIKKVGLAAMILISSGLLMGQAMHSKVIEADEFVVRDSNRVVRVRIGLYSGDPEIELNSAAGKPRVQLSFFELHGGNSSLTFKDAQGSRRIDLSVNDEIGAGLGVWDQGHKALTAIGEGGFELRDAEGFSAALGNINLITPTTGETHRTSAASVVLFGKDGKVLWRAP